MGPEIMSDLHVSAGAFGPAHLLRNRGFLTVDDDDVRHGQALPAVRRRFLSGHFRASTDVRPAFALPADFRPNASAHGLIGRLRSLLLLPAVEHLQKLVTEI